MVLNSNFFLIAFPRFNCFFFSTGGGARPWPAVVERPCTSHLLGNRAYRSAISRIQKRWPMLETVSPQGAQFPQRSFPTLYGRTLVNVRINTLVSSLRSGRGCSTYSITSHLSTERMCGWAGKGVFPMPQDYFSPQLMTVDARIVHKRVPKI